MSILINENERYISNCEFKIESVSDRNFEFNINDFVNFILNNYWKNPYFRKRKTEAFRILRAKLVDSRYLVLFLQYTNAKASDPAFAKLDSGKSRIVKKASGEGVACSAHLVINTQSTDIPNRYNAVLEDMQGLSCRSICDLLNHILRTYKVQDPNEEKKAHRPRTTLTFFAKNNFEEQLSDGELEAVIAYKEELKKSKVMDEPDTISYKETHSLTFTKPGIIFKPIEYIAKAAKIAKKEGFRKIKITHKANNKEQSTNYAVPEQDMNDQDMLEDIRLSPFVSKTLISLTKPIGICNQKWHSEIIREMIKNLI